MIEYIKGELTEVTPTLAVVEAAGVGYGINISLNTYTAIQTKKEVKLYIHEAIMTGGRDDSYTLYGFVNKQERELYRMLITVSGVGSNTARMILSATTPTELVNVISSGNEKMLKSVKGIGLRTAQRIIVDLRDKMAASGLIADLQSSAAAAGMPILSGTKSEGGCGYSQGSSGTACRTGYKTSVEVDKIAPNPVPFPARGKGVDSISNQKRAET